MCRSSNQKLFKLRFYHQLTDLSTISCSTQEHDNITKVQKSSENFFFTVKTVLITEWVNCVFFDVLIKLYTVIRSKIHH